ncbi:MAG: toll/interleukin-1 receptor domain-containing protein [Candidatus Omnitrophica bacterium]|nr:toll/interleukin-1 receptor domain-containing protein [Candidatus Omnitrophota bacterium]
MKWDVFICHANEDKLIFVEKLAHELRNKGLRVWYDNFALKLGDSLRRTIDEGVSKSRYGIVVLSKAFFVKNWTQYELDGLVHRENTGEKVILPIWLDVTSAEVAKYSPSLANKVAVRAEAGTEEVLQKILEVIKPDLAEEFSAAFSKVSRTERQDRLVEYQPSENFPPRHEVWKWPWNTTPDSQV